MPLNYSAIKNQKINHVILPHLQQQLNPNAAVFFCVFVFSSNTSCRLQRVLFCVFFPLVAQFYFRCNCVLFLCTLLTNLLHFGMEFYTRILDISQNFGLNLSQSHIYAVTRRIFYDFWDNEPSSYSIDFNPGERAKNKNKKKC